MVDTDKRTLGWTGASIGTSLAFERITNTGEFDTEVEPPAILKMDVIYVNLRTLIRNAYNSYESADQPYLTAEQIAEVVTSDWDSIMASVSAGNAQTEVNVYLCTYEGISEKIPEGNFKNNTTAKQLAFEATERGAIEFFKVNRKDDFSIIKYAHEGENKRCVMLTHLPFDLLSYTKFKDLLLLESHTGKLKPRQQWHTKLAVKKDGPIIPFNLIMLCIFGDSSMLSAQPIAIRRVLLKISEARKWHALTTHDKIIQDIKLAHEPNLLEFVRRYDIKL